MNRIIIFCNQDNQDSLKLILQDNQEIQIVDYVFDGLEALRICGFHFPAAFHRSRGLFGDGGKFFVDSLSHHYNSSSSLDIGPMRNHGIN